MEIDGSIHYYNRQEQIASQKTEFKYRLLDLYEVPYLRLECFDYILEANKNTKANEAGIIIDS